MTYFYVIIDKNNKGLIMAQSLNQRVILQTTAVSYLGIGGKVGKILLGDKALEFYNDKNVEDFIQIPWTAINQIGANVSGKKDRKSTRLNSSHANISYAVFCLKKKKNRDTVNIQ